MNEIEPIHIQVLEAIVQLAAVGLVGGLIAGAVMVARKLFGGAPSYAPYTHRGYDDGRL